LACLALSGRSSGRHRCQAKHVRSLRLLMPNGESRPHAYTGGVGFYLSRASFSSTSYFEKKKENSRRVGVVSTVGTRKSKLMFGTRTLRDFTRILGGQMHGLTSMSSQVPMRRLKLKHLHNMSLYMFQHITPVIRSVQARRVPPPRHPRRRRAHAARVGALALAVTSSSSGSSRSGPSRRRPTSPWRCPVTAS
jgi:hypothetical protein